MSQSRPPIIAIVGHIDHGKSKLQHALRNMDAKIIEAGDITQHIGAYELHATYEGSDRRATVIDTPGHEAFSHVREHGTDLADLALLVISSEEGWKPQTKEAYTLIQEKNMPCIIVFTKIDTEKANLERAKQTVLQEGILLEGLGGSMPWTAVSSVTNEGIPDLIDLIFLTTDVYNITEDVLDGAIGTLVEADIDPKTGIAGTVIVCNGTLENSKYIRVGKSIAPLRIMKNDRGKTISSAGASTPVRVIGFDKIPQTGERVFMYDTKKEAVEEVKRQSDTDEHQQNSAATDEDRTIPIVLRSDTASGLSSIEYAINNVAVDGVTFTILKAEVGRITEEDVRMALAQKDGHVVGFHTDADQRAKQLAERSGIPINLFSTIYQLIDWVTEISKKKKGVYELQNLTGEGTIIRVFDEQPAQGIYIVGAQIRDGFFTVGQEILLQKNGEQTGRFTIESIEQRNAERQDATGEKTQFAMRIKGSGTADLQDVVFALPSMQEK